MDFDVGFACEISAWRMAQLHMHNHNATAVAICTLI